MGVSAAQQLSRTNRKFSVYVKIEGLGIGLSAADLAATDGDGQYWFCSTTPHFVDLTTGVYKDILVSFPDVMSERGSILGGNTDLSSVQVEILDFEDLLTTHIDLLSGPSTTLAESIDADDTEFDVADGSVLSDTEPGNVIYVGAEALLVDTVATNTLTVIRGYLGTTATVHDLGDPVYEKLPYLRGRRMQVYRIPTDASSTSAATLIGDYAIDDVAWSDDFNVWILSGLAQRKYLSRLAPISPRVLKLVEEVYPGVWSTETVSDVRPGQIWTGSQGSDEEQFYLQVGGEVVTCKRSGAGHIEITRRAVVGTKQADFKAGDLGVQVFVAEVPGPGSFRFSDSRSEDRSAAAWTQSSHWVDILLSIITSSSEDTDGLELINHPADTYPNLSWLPPGYGLGIPHDQIDWSSFMDVKLRTLDYRFGTLVYGAEPTAFLEWADREILQPIGARIIQQTGLVTLSLPRAASSGLTYSAVDHTNIISRRTGNRTYLPEVSVRMGYASQAGSIKYLVGPQETCLTFNSAAYSGTYGQRGFYSHDEKPVEIKVRGVHYDESGFLGREAAGRLFRFHRPTLEATILVDAELFATQVGALLEITLDEVPNIGGSRGWSGVYAEVLEVEPHLGPDKAELMLLVHVWPSLRIDRVGPAAIVSGVSGDDDEISTVVENRYTQGDVIGLPDTDALAFSEGDVCVIIGLDGTGSDTCIIEDITGNNITWSDESVAYPGVGDIVVYAPIATPPTSNQIDTFAWLGSAGSSIVGSRPRSQYGEP